MLYGRRKRLRKIEMAEAEGRSFWTNKLDETARFKLGYAVSDLAQGMTGQYSFDLLGAAQRKTLSDLGLPRLSKRQTSDASEDVMNACLHAGEDVIFSLLEALILLSAATSGGGRGLGYEDYLTLHERLPVFVGTIRSILREHRLSFDLIDGRFIPMESREMHEDVVVPALTLLGGRKDLARVEVAYQEALDELHTGTPDDAITDAGTALQETLVALGCDGNALGPLANSARSKGIISAHDRKLID